MKILAVSHSMVHPRQQWFFKKIGRLITECIIVGPRFWHDLGMNDSATKNFSMIGLPAYNPGEVFEYWLAGLDEVINEIKPDFVYCQAELRSKQTLNAMQLSVGHSIPFIIFIWENIFAPKTPDELEILKQAKLVICGNIEAKNLIPEEFQEKCRVIPQVGIELEKFHPYPNIEQKFEVIYCGRPAIEKGIEIIKAGCNELNCSFNLIHNANYEKIPQLISEGKIFASLPVTTKNWKEQSGSYSNLEAMACGLPVITTHCGAIPEYLEDSALYCDENSVEDFKSKLQTLLFNKNLYTQYQDKGLNKVKNFSNEKIAEKLVEELKKCM